MIYTNRSAITKTFHGVTFRPGETKEVSGIINDPTFVPSSMRKEPPERDRSEVSESIEETSESKTTKKKVVKKQKISEDAEDKIDSEIVSNN